MTTPSSNVGADASREAKVPSLDDFVFAWFNARQPDEISACVEAYYLAVTEAKEALPTPPAGETK